MKDIFTEELNPCNLRNKATLKASKPKTVYNGTETLSFRGPQTWTLVPENIKQSRSLAEFKIKIKSWKSKGCKCRLCKIYEPQIGFI